MSLCVSIPKATVVQEVEKSFSNQKVASSIPCRSVLEQDTEPVIARDVAVCRQCKCKMCIHCKSHICKLLWIKASAKLLNVNVNVVWYGNSESDLCAYLLNYSRVAIY